MGFRVIPKAPETPFLALLCTVQCLHALGSAGA